MNINDFDTFLETALKDRKLLRHLFSENIVETGKSDCLSDELLAEFIDKVLPAEQIESVFAHIAWCDDCLELLIETSNCIVEETVPLKEQIQIVTKLKPFQEKLNHFVVVVKSFPDRIATIFQDGGFIPLAVPAYAVRGTQNSMDSNIIILSGKVPPFNFDLEIEKKEVGSFRIKILIKCAEDTLNNNIRVSLFMGGDEYDSGIVDKGSVSFDDLEEGKYLVMIVDKQKLICEFDISLL